MGRSVPRTLAVVAFYVALALFSIRELLPAFGSAALLPADIPRRWLQISGSDLKLTIALVAANARAFLHDPSSLFDGPQCFPLHNAATLGEHAFGLGILGVVPYVLTGGDPIVTFNVVVVMVLILTGLAMHLLVERWTGSTGAAFVAGTVFAIHPMRLDNLLHLYIVSTQWIPLALLATGRLFARRTWTAAAWAALFIGWQTLESVYPLIAFTLIGGTYGVWAMLRHRRALPSLAPKLIAVVIAVGALVLVVFGPYVETRRVWGTLGGRTTLFLSPSDFGPGGNAFSGTVLSLFAVVALVDRLRGARREWAGDPRLALALAGVLVLWASVGAITIPGIATPVPSLFRIVAGVVPALSALRGGPAIAAGVMLVTAILAGFGVAALVNGRSPLVRGAVAVLAVGAGLTEVFVPKIARATFGITVSLGVLPLRPPSPVVALYGAGDEGAVIDVPFAFGLGKFAPMGDWVFLGAFHHRRVASCYNSFHVALQDEIVAHAAGVLGDAREAEALAALGIRDVVVHPWLPGQMPMLVPTVPPAHLREVGRAFGNVRYTLPSPGPQTADWSPLAAGAAARAQVGQSVTVKGGAPAVDVTVANGGTLMYRRPDPIQPVPLVARWRNAAGQIVREEQATRYVPAVVPAGSSVVQRVPFAALPEPGRYALTLAPAAQPDLVIAAQAVEVTP